MTPIHPMDQMLLDQAARYPALEVGDLIKALYQATLGSGHFVADAPEGRAFLRRELEDSQGARRMAPPPLVEPLGPAFCRVHLSPMAEAGLAPDTLFTLFAQSAREASGEMAALIAGLERLEALIRRGAFPLDQEAALAHLRDYRARGCPPARHSAAFRASHVPAYRVIQAAYAPFLPVFAGIDRLLARQGRAMVAIEGGSASGKTSLAALLARVYDCNVFHMDDFFLQAHQRTPERYQEPGGNVDYERFEQEVQKPLLAGGAFSYRPFDCQTMAFRDRVPVTPRALNIVEGAYSLHPRLAEAYDLRVFLQIDKASQAARILKRNGPALQQRFLGEWIPLEEAYFAATGAKARAQVVVEVGD